MNWFYKRFPSSLDDWKPFVLILLFCLIAITVVAAVDDYTVSDFFTFWLAGRMTLQGQDVYSEAQWLDGHKFYGSTWFPNPIFPYPIALSLVLLPLGALPLKFAYLIWVFITQLMLLLSVFLLSPTWNTKESKNGRYLLVVSLLLFRPVLVTLLTAQFVGFFLFVCSLSVYLWKKEKWFMGGLVISLLNLKPSYGAAILVLAGIWLLFQKRNTAILAIILGNLSLGLVGLMQNSQWIRLFLETGERKISQTMGLYPTIWSLAYTVCDSSASCTAIGGSVTILFITCFYVYLIYLRRNQPLDPLEVFALVMPVALLSTYNWAYDQILLVVTITFCIQKIIGYSHKFFPNLFTLLVDAISLLLLVWAYFHRMDVWSLLVPAGLFAVATWFWVEPWIVKNNFLRKSAV